MKSHALEMKEKEKLKKKKKPININFKDEIYYVLRVQTKENENLQVHKNECL